MATRRPSTGGFGAHSRNQVGIRRLLRRDHGSELEISLYPADRFFNGDYGMFDCSGMAFTEAVTSPVTPPYIEYRFGILRTARAACTGLSK